MKFNKKTTHDINIKIIIEETEKQKKIKKYT